MTLVLKLDLDMVKMYQHTKKWSFYVKRFKSYSLNRQKHRQTDMTENITYPHTRVVIKKHIIHGKLLRWQRRIILKEFDKIE